MFKGGRNCLVEIGVGDPAAVALRNTLLWDMKPCRLVQVRKSRISTEVTAVLFADFFRLVIYIASLRIALRGRPVPPFQDGSRLEGKACSPTLG
jgi:hypothetical protein